MVLGEGKGEELDDSTISPQQVLNVAPKEIESKIPLITSELNYENGYRKVIGYQILVTDNRKVR